MNRRVGALLWIGLFASLAGCGGGGDDLLGETAIRDCLGRAQIRPNPELAAGAGSTGYAPIYAADFRAYAEDGVAVDVVVQASAQRAERTAAHVRSALASLGRNTADDSGRVLSAKNAVAIFQRNPKPADRAAVRACLAG